MESVDSYHIYYIEESLIRKAFVLDTQLNWRTAHPIWNNFKLSLWVKESCPLFKGHLPTYRYYMPSFVKVGSSVLGKKGLPTDIRPDGLKVCKIPQKCAWFNGPHCLVNTMTQVCLRTDKKHEYLLVGRRSNKTRPTISNIHISTSCRV